jgi:hypothetical protein
LRALYGLLTTLNGAGTKSEASFGLTPKTDLMAVQIEGPRFSTRTSVGERPSEKAPLLLGLVTGVSLETRVGLGDALEAMGSACDAFLTGKVGIWSRLLCRQRCMNSSALPALAVI